MHKTKNRPNVQMTRLEHNETKSDLEMREKTKYYTE